MSDDVGPLAKLMIDASETIEKVIDEIGPSAVAEFFINAGTGIAMAYELTDADGDKSIPVIPEENSE